MYIILIGMYSCMSTKTSLHPLYIYVSTGIYYMLYVYNIIYDLVTLTYDQISFFQVKNTFTQQSVCLFIFHPIDPSTSAVCLN